VVVDSILELGLSQYLGVPMVALGPIVGDVGTFKWGQES
jgi:hypothetical protein